jgi:hypothetical protein
VEKTGGGKRLMMQANKAAMLKAYAASSAGKLNISLEC